MKAELQKQLFDKYPDLFVEKDLPMSQTCMCWGIETGDGWYTILDKLCEKIARVNRLQGSFCTFTQVKEKFGTLRVYYNSSQDDLDIIGDLVSHAENQSAATCEKCGEFGEMHDDGWVTVRCRKCKKAKDGE